VRSRGGFALLAAAAVSSALVAPAGAWVRTIAGSGSSYDSLLAAAGMPDGDVVVLGCPHGVVRLDGASGRPRWRFPGTPSAADCPRYRVDLGLVVASDGTIVYAGGGVVVSRAGDSGIVRWQHEVEGANDYDDPANLVAVALTGADVVAAGGLDQGGDEDTFDQNFLVEKLAGADGHVLWRRLLDGSPRTPPDDCSGGCDDPGYPDDHANAVTVRADGMVVAAGAIERHDVPHFTVIAFAGTSGDEAWRWESTPRGEAFAVAADTDGTVVAAGQIDGAPAVVAFAPDGSVRWQQTAPPGDPLDAWRVLSLGAAHDVLVTGRVAGRAVVASYASSTGAPRWRVDEPDRGRGVALRPAADAVIALLGLDGTGILDLGRWRVRALDPSTGATRWLVEQSVGSPVGLAVDARHVIVAGTTQNPETFYDATAIALDPDDGRARWRRDLDSPPESYGNAQAIAVSPRGDVVAAGLVSNPLTSFDFTVASFSAHAGRLRWQRELDGSYDFAQAVRTDVHGDVIAAGTIDYRLAVVKLDGATGAERWRALDDSQNFLDYATALAVDGRGDAVAGGIVHDDLDVRKLDGETGAVRWDARIPMPTYTGSLYDVATAGDDVFVGAAAPDQRFVRVATLFRLDGTTGEVAARHGFGDGAVVSVAPRDGGVVVGGSIDRIVGRSGFVAALDRASDTERWRVDFEGGQFAYRTVSSVAVDARGDVLACVNMSDTRAALVRKLDGASGATVWDQSLPAEILRSLHCALDADGDIAIAIGAGDASRVLWLDGTTGRVRSERTIDAPIYTLGGFATDAAGNVFGAAEQGFPGNGFLAFGLGGRAGSGRPQRPARSSRR